MVEFEDDLVLAEYEASISKITSGTNTYYLADLQARKAIQSLATNLKSFKADDKKLALEVEEVKTGFDKTIKNNLDNLKLPKKDLEITTGTNITDDDNAIWLDDEYDWKVKYE